MMRWNKFFKYLVVLYIVIGSLICYGQDVQLPKADFEFTTELTDLNREVRPLKRPYEGQLIDMLTHIDPSYDKNLVIPLLNANSIEYANVMPVPNEGLKTDDGKGTKEKIAFSKANDKNIKVFCGGDYLTIWISKNQQASNESPFLKQRLSQLDQDLKNGACKGMGEFGLLHFAKIKNQNVITNSPNSYSVLKLIDVVAINNSWIQLHAEPMEPNGISHHSEVFGALALWFKRNPNLKIIMSHTAMTSPANARKILEIYPNVYMSIKIVKSKQGYWNHLEPVTDLDGNFYEDWAQLFEQMPDRFFIGSDVKFGQKNNHDNELDYPRNIRSLRRALGSLQFEAAEKIAWKNASRWFFY